jgi:hypothetical protein
VLKVVQPLKGKPSYRAVSHVCFDRQSGDRVDC